MYINTIIVIVYAHGKFTFKFWITNRDVIHMHSLYENKLEDAGTQALVEGLQHCTNLQVLGWVICVSTWHYYSACTWSGL